MSNLLLQIYHRLPSPARSVASTMRGFYLRSWRYGPETERLVREALEREHWTPEQWEGWRQARLELVLQRAATQVPYYREQWAQRRRHGDRSSWSYLENWPILQKEPLRQQAPAFVAEDCDVRRMFNEHTSGTSGKPLNLWLSAATVRSWYALFEARWRRWNHVSRHDRWAIVGGQLVTPFSQTYPPFWVWNAGLRQLYMSSYHLAPDFVPAYLDALRRYRVEYILGYASSLYSLAQIALERGLEAPALKVAISNAEPLYDHQREVIARVFQCPVSDTYGMSEMVTAASECTEGSLHLWPEVGITEVLADSSNDPVAAGQVGRFVCTGLLNADMPLIRYHLGDRGAVAADDEVCACGRTLPILQSVEGRLDDVVVTPDGRRVGRLDPIFKADLPIREAQIVQESLDHIRILYVPSPEWTEQDGASIIQRLRDRVGDVSVLLEPVESIPRGSNGKFRAVISKVASMGSDVSLVAENRD